MGRGPQGDYTVSVLESPAGQPNASFSLPLGAEIREHLHTLETFRGLEVSRRGGPVSAASQTSVDLPKVAHDLGERFFSALTQDQAIYGCYSTSLFRARDQKKGLRLRLRIEAPDLAALPWEYLYDPHLKRDHLCLYRETPIVRHLETELPVEPLVLEPPIQVLCMVGYSRGLDVDRERRQLELSVEHLTDRGILKLGWVSGHTWRDLQRDLRANTWHVFHFIGHGGFDPESGEGLVELEAEVGGGKMPLAAGDLAALLAQGHAAPKLVVLNSCDGARASATDLDSSTAAVLASRGIPAVVSMQFEISDRAALEFARTFYDTLADGKPVDEAVSEARMAIRLALGKTAEWGTPVLHMRAKDGTLFRIDLARSIFHKPSGPSGNVPLPSAGIALPEVSLTPPSPSPSQPPSFNTRKGLKLLAERVRQIWVEGVLTRSLDRAARIELGKELMPGAVDSPWEATLDTSDGRSEPVPPGRTCRDVFEEIGGSLLILGEPGAGKTITLLELARDLLVAAGDDEGRPIPVVFNLSSWSATKAPIPEWLAEELSVKYMIPKKIGRAWLEEGRFMPLLDGLDEVKAEARTACAVAINTFSQGARPTGVVVCCRLKEYLEIPTRLSLNGALRLQQLNREQVFAYIRAGGERLSALKLLLERDSGLLLEARTPLMLSLMARAYGDLPADTLEVEGAETLEERRRKLMEAYVMRMFRLAGLGSASG